MNSGEQPYRRYLFTVRLWQENPDADQFDAGQSEVRGQVQYASDGERLAFRDWPELITFFESKLKESRENEEQR